MTNVTHGEGNGSQEHFRSRAETARAVYEAYYARGAPKNRRVYPKGELKGLCPNCGGDDRFWTRPDGFGCRKCEPGGNTVTAKAAYLAILEALGIANGESTQPAFKPRHTAPKRKDAPVPEIDGERPKEVTVTRKVASPRKPRGAKRPTGEPPVYYEYPDADGSVKWRVKRTPAKFPDNSPTKIIKQERWHSGRWIPGKPDEYKGLSKAPLYNLQNLAIFQKNWPRGERTVYIVEGEKCADAVNTLMSKIAVTWAGGTATWRNADWTPLRGERVLLISDADSPGRSAMHAIASHLHSKLGCSVWIAAMPGETGDDIADWLESSGPEGAAEHIKPHIKAYHPGDTQAGAAAREDTDDPYTYWGREDRRLTLPKILQTKGGDPDSGPWAVAEATDPNIAAALRHLGYRLRYDLLSARPQVSKDGGPWEIIRERYRATLRSELAEHFIVFDGRSKEGKTRRLRLSDSAWRAFHLSAQGWHEVDAFGEYVTNLPTWDGEKRIEYVLQHCLGTEDTPINRWASGFIFMGPVKRSVEPGAKLDETPILIGPEDVGKSTLLRYVFPPGHRHWHGDQTDFGHDYRRIVESTLGRKIVELAEWRGFRRKSANSIKALLSTVDDGQVRLAYRVDPEPLPRRFVFVGTTNNESPLPNDPTGLRRFVPVRTPGGQGTEFMRAYLNTNRAQLWAEAYARVKAGERVYLPPSLKAQQRELTNDARAANTVMEDRVTTLPVTDVKGEPWTMTRLCEVLYRVERKKHEPTWHDRKEVQDALRNMGWLSKKRRFGKTTRNTWIPPSAWVPTKQPEEEAPF